ncbi:hypothetical protein AAW51_3721 [Caldimonas brevitalea]|uniref:Uncharacterized protein n=1 Tax=Caldimonas brevitalea TaxID=413882 RepID=A0A0G3BLZ1_9BURK|nr:hypothetical protein AAW51_3721 [Caldimonas brevitalea]
MELDLPEARARARQARLGVQRRIESQVLQRSRVAVRTASDTDAVASGDGAAGSFARPRLPA